MIPEINTDGKVLIEGQYMGRLQGLCFQMDGKTKSLKKKDLHRIIEKVLEPEISRRLDKISRTARQYFHLDSTAHIHWKGMVIARLKAGKHPLTPSIHLIGNFSKQNPLTRKVQKHLESWLEDQIETELAPLWSLHNAIKEEKLTGLARGIGYLLWENLGRLYKEEHHDLVKSVSPEERRELRKFNIRFGQYYIYMPFMIKPRPSNLLSILFTCHLHENQKPYLPPPGRTSLPRDPQFSNMECRVAGYHPSESIIIRLDILERLADEIRNGLQLGLKAYGVSVFAETDAMRSLLGSTREELTLILKALGYQQTHTPTAEKRKVSPKPSSLAQQSSLENENKNKDYQQLSFDSSQENSLPLNRKTEKKVEVKSQQTLRQPLSIDIQAEKEESKEKKEIGSKGLSSQSVTENKQNFWKYSRYKHYQKRKKQQKKKQESFHLSPFSALQKL